MIKMATLNFFQCKESYEGRGFIMKKVAVLCLVIALLLAGCGNEEEKNFDSATQKLKMSKIEYLSKARAKKEKYETLSVQ
jgi:uncharacterized lipoprotein YehR (DUF1307 family)